MEDVLEEVASEWLLSPRAVANSPFICSQFGINKICFKTSYADRNEIEK